MWSWLSELSQAHPTAHAILLLAVVVAVGQSLGGLQLRGIRLGSAGVLFAGLLVGQFGQDIDHALLGFLKEFGLVLFVFTIGLQLGPGFAASLRAEGLRLNLLATAVVALGAGLAVAACVALPLQPAGVLGALSGAVTNTPSLGATQQALKGLADATQADLPAIAYAVAYPGGILGIIAALLILRRWARAGQPAGDPHRAEALAADRLPGAEREPFERRTLVVDNRQLDGLTVARIPGQREAGVTISRLRGHAEREVRVATPTTVVHTGDRLLVVGPRSALDRFQPVVGAAVDEDLVSAPGRVAFTRLVVTAAGAAGVRLGDLRCGERFGVTVTRVLRSGVEMSPDPALRLHFGDVLHAVGELPSLEAAAGAVGNQPKELDQTHFAAVFLGIALGVVAGLVPLAVPGLPEPVRLGLAGGPLLIAILLGRLGNVGRMVWHMPEVANRAVRELGISLFLAAVGLSAGPAFAATVVTGTGLAWAALGLVITMVPLLLVGGFAQRALRMPPARVGGMLAGSMTDPPALAFANGIAGSEAPATAYAAVYPLTMLLRIVIAQVLVVVLCR